MAVRVLPEDSDTESAEVSDSRIRVIDGFFFEVVANLRIFYRRDGDFVENNRACILRIFLILRFI